MAADDEPRSAAEQREEHLRRKPPGSDSAASFDESPEERDQRRRERADKARPNVSMTPGQAETLAKSAAHKHEWLPGGVVSEQWRYPPHRTLTYQVMVCKCGETKRVRVTT